LTTEFPSQNGPANAAAAAADTAVVQAAQFLLDTPNAGALPLLPEQNAAGQDNLPPLVVTEATAPLKTTAGPSAGAIGGGASHYDSDFGNLFAGLQRNTAEEAVDGTPTPGGFAALAATGGATLSLFAQATIPGVPANTDAGPGGDGDDIGNGGDALQLLFTVHPDSVDFNGVKAGSYLGGTQYDTDNQDDFVILPSDADEAAEAGFLPGILFLANNGNDTVIGGTLGDLVDGGNGEDLLIGGGGDDSLFGGTGRDTLIGGAGDDVMSGGTGRDVFVYALTADEGNDVILDFDSGKGGDSLRITDLTDVNGDGAIDIGDLDAGGHSVTGTADAVVITFNSGTTITLDGLDGSGVNAFADLVDNTKVNIDIV
jgi:Ca2+-binding RTX toxin-like protein